MTFAWQKVNQNLPPTVASSSGIYPRCDEGVPSVSLPVGGTDGHRAGGSVAVVGRDGHPALHAVSPDLWNCPQRKTGQPTTQLVLHLFIYLSYKESYYIHINCLCTRLQLRRWWFVNNICIYWWLCTFEMYDKKTFKKNFILILIVQNNTVKMAWLSKKYTIVK